MNLSIRRQGIVIKTVSVKGDRARIGSGEDCELQLNDPYLAAHVADLIERQGQWRIVDAGTSLEGISLDGARIEDEILQFGKPYVVGGFEVVAEPATVKASPIAAGAAASRVPAEPSEAFPKTMMAGEVEVPRTMFGGTAVPKTMMAGDVEVPRTMFGGTAIPLAPPSATVPPPQTNRPVVAATPQSGAPAQSGITPPSKKRMLLLGCGVILVVILLTLGLIIGFSKPAAVATKPAVAQPSPKPAAPVTAPMTSPDAGTPIAPQAQYDRALAGWAATLDKSPTAELRARYARTAFEVGMVYSAAHRTPEAAAYFQKVVKYGEPGSKEVLTAKSRLGLQ